MAWRPILLLLSVSVPFVFAGDSVTVRATAHDGTGTAPPARRWYFSAMDHDGDMPMHAGHHERSWEPEHAVDPASLRGFQRMYEVTRYPDVETPTPEQQRQADELVRKCHESAQRHGWFDFKQATKDGFVRMFGEGIHYVNEANVLDDRLLDPDRPEFLLFYDTRVGKRLAGFMFLVRKPDERGPQIGGPLTVWHYHLWAKQRCLLKRLFVVGDPADGRCEHGQLAQRSPEMMHVWFVRHPQGPFATEMGLSDGLRAQLEQAKWP